MEKLESILESVRPVDRNIEGRIRSHLDDLTKPPGSLGRIEDIAARYCLIQNSAKPRLGEKVIFTFGADHGVSRDGVSAFPREVTPQMVRNMLAGGAAISVLARHCGARHVVVDIGVDDPLEGVEGLYRRKIRRGTGNIAEGPAMTVEEARTAVQVGFELAHDACAHGATMVGTGEIGIGNTTPSAALMSTFLPCEPEEATGRGTGVDDKGLDHKREVVRRALEVNREMLGEPLNALAAVGGLEIAAISGLAMGAASCRAAVVVDGFISSAGVLVACAMCPAVKDYLFFSHCSAEVGHVKFFEKFAARPILDLGMRLGEGTGAALAMSIVEAAVKIYNEMATFSSAGVSNKE